MFVVSSVQFALATGHVITLLVQLIRAFIGAAGTLDGPSLYLEDQSTPEHVAQEVLYITNVRLLTAKSHTTDVLTYCSLIIIRVSSGTLSWCVPFSSHLPRR